MGWNFRKKKNIPGGLWLKCPGCGAMLQRRNLEERHNVCNECEYHFKVTAKDRVRHILDEGSFVELGKDLVTSNPLDFEGYAGTIERSKKRSNMDEGALCGHGTIDGIPTAFCSLDFHFVGGSMGVVVGTRITIAAEYAFEQGTPLIVVSTSGGARMHEGALSLMQMAKTSAAIARMGEQGLPYISVLADPCTGGVIASYAALGDVIIAEPGALIGFAGPRVIQTTIGTQLPDGFQTSEFLLEHGFIDRIVSRTQLTKELTAILRFTAPGLVSSTADPSGSASDALTNEP